MTKPTTVAEAMRALSETFAVTKPAPVEVRVVADKLTSAESGRLLMGLLMSWPLRALVVWGFLAIFFPAFGATYVAVLFGLWAIGALLPPKVDVMAKGIIAQRK